MKFDILLKRIKSEDANTLVENVILMPLIFIIIFGLIMTCFVLHDRTTVEAAAKRGAIYAAHCISDPNYTSILSQSGNKAGSLDTSITSTSDIHFKGVGKNIQPYRYIVNKSQKINEDVVSEVKKIVQKTNIPWRELDVDSVKYKCVNKVFYQDVTVTLKAEYPLPQIFGAFGLETKYEYSVSAKMAVNDPDEFIRNADLVVDTITRIDNVTGNHLESVKEKITTLASKILDWIKI